MLPGKSIILKCSACKKLIEQETISSGNTFGARYWTDGKEDTPMLPDAPQFVKCGHCATLIWIDEQLKVGEIEQPWLNNGYFKGSCRYKIPSAQDYFSALAVGNFFDKHRELYLRLQAWWTGNDIRRQKKNPPPLSKDEIANLRAFVKMIKRKESHEEVRIMKAEIMRELGNYKEAMKLLSKPFSKELAYTAKKIKELALLKNPFVQEID